MKGLEALGVAALTATCHAPGGYDDHGGIKVVDDTLGDWEVRDQDTSALITSGCVLGTRRQELPTALVRKGQHVQYRIVFSKIFVDWQQGIDQQPTSFWCAQERKGPVERFASVDCYHPTEDGAKVARLIAAANIGSSSAQQPDANILGQVDGVNGYALTLEVLAQGAFSRIMDACSLAPNTVTQDVAFLFPD